MPSVSGTDHSRRPLGRQGHDATVPLVDDGVDDVYKEGHHARPLLVRAVSLQQRVAHGPGKTVVNENP